MTVLDKFYLLFQTDIPTGVEKDIKNLDKQISDLAAKGKKRSVEEQAELKQLRKQRLEATQDIKDQTRESEKLNDSFQNLVTNAVGAVTAYTSFSFLKNALVDANNLNASLKILGQTYHLDAPKVEKYARAAELIGLDKNAVYSFFVQQKTFAQQNGLPSDPDSIIKNLRSQYGTPNFWRQIDSVQGGRAIVPLLGLNQKEFDENLAKGGKTTPTQTDLDAAVANKSAASEASQAFNKISTEIDTRFSDAVKDFYDAVQNFTGAFQGHPVAAGIAELAGAAGAGLAIKSLLGSIPGLGAIGGAAVKNRYVLGALALGAAGFGAYEYFKNPAVATSPSARGASGEWDAGVAAPPGNTSRKQQILDFWQSKGYTPGQAAGFAANAQAESGFGSHLLGYDGRHFGLYQWSNDRRKKILAGTGIDVATANLDDQLAAAAWETNKLGFTPDRIPKDARGSAAYLNNKFEVSSNDPTELASKAHYRADIASSYGDIPQSGSVVNSGSGSKTISIKIDDVKIETQATDASGIAGAVAGELKNQIRMAIANIDDGISA